MKKELLLLCAALSISFAVAEIVCRLNGKYLSYLERTGAGDYTSPFEVGSESWIRVYPPYERHLLKRNEFTDSWTANEDGLKDKNISPRKQGKRILVLGDSFTEGVGATPDSAYPRILESLIQLHTDSIQVINAGIGGSDIFFEYKLLQALNPKYKPDMVIATCNPSDIPEYFTRGGFERFLADSTVRYRRAPWFEPLYAHSLLVRLLIHDVFKYDFNFIIHRDYKRELAKAEEEMCTALDSLQLFCNANNLRFSIVFHPLYPDVQHPETYAMKNLILHCRKKNIPYTDALDFLKQNGINDKNWKNIYWASDGHFNREGYRLLASCVNDFLKKQDWLN